MKVLKPHSFYVQYQLEHKTLEESENNKTKTVK